MTEQNPRARIAYLTGQYPAVSLTFILREIEAVRAAGLAVDTYAIERTPPQEHPAEQERAEAARTFYIKAAALNPLLLLKALVRALASPGRTGAALALAWRTRPPGARAALYQLFYFAESLILAERLQSTGATHLHNHFASASATVAMLAAHLTDIPFSFTLHGPADLEEPRRIALDEKIARAAFVACISHFARSQAMRYSDPAHWDKLRIIHCGVDPALYHPTPAPQSPPVELLFVGRLAPVKGLRVLFEALALLNPAAGNWQLTVVGNGPDRKGLEAAARPLGPWVHFTGALSQAEVAERLRNSHIFVLPSFAEGVPVVLMEALASGRPVVATQVAGVGELVEDGVTGRLVPPGDSVALANALSELVADADLRARMGAAGPPRVAEEFNIATEAFRIAALFKGTAGPGIRPDPQRNED